MKKVKKINVLSNSDFCNVYKLDNEEYINVEITYNDDGHTTVVYFTKQDVEKMLETFKERNKPLDKNH